MICAAELIDKNLDALQIRDRMLDQLAEMWNSDNFAAGTPQSTYYNTSFTRAKMEGIASVLLVAGSLTALVMARGMSPSTLVARQQAA